MGILFLSEYISKVEVWIWNSGGVGARPTTQTIDL
jgi:hypothetical protein